MAMTTESSVALVELGEPGIRDGARAGNSCTGNYNPIVAKRPLIRYRLNPANVQQLPHEDIVAILRAADSMIASGGRTLLTRVLKGSREKSVLAHGLDRNPSYGYYRELATDDVAARVDWMITNGYLAIAYQGQLPVIVFTPRGWEIELETMADELLRGLDSILATGPPYDMSHLKDRDRGMILRLLEKVEETGRKELIPLLEAWAAIDYKKVNAAIRRVVLTLKEKADRH